MAMEAAMHDVLGPRLNPVTLFMPPDWQPASVRSASA
jgi:hypothetical protein